MVDPNAVILITGAAKGIGRATAELAHARGARVAAADIAPSPWVTPGDRIIALDGDVGHSTDAERLVRATVDRFGRIDVLINNAGVLDRFLPVGEVTDDVWDHVLAVNLSGPMYLCRAAIPHMLAAGHGTIVNVASIGGIFGARAGVAYTASKHGLIGLTRNVAATYGRDGIRCVALCPGAVGTGISPGGQPSGRGYTALERTLAANPRLASADEIARILLFLASDDAGFVNGAAIVADGGWTAA